jgi:hypothetical protein
MAVVRFTSFPRTLLPPTFVPKVVQVFEDYASQIGTKALQKGLTSDGVLLAQRNRLRDLKFDVEASKRSSDKIKRPVYFGEDGKPALQCEVDAYQSEWRCGLEIEAGRAWMGNAVYRDLIQALVIVNLAHLILAVPNSYKYFSNNKLCTSQNYKNTASVTDAIYGHNRISMPFSLAVLGY